MHPPSRLIRGVLLAAGCTAAASAAQVIRNVPYHRQLTDYACGDASVEMLLHRASGDVDQRAIIDVMRTSDTYGTLSDDIVRAVRTRAECAGHRAAGCSRARLRQGHFSALSAAAASVLFPDSAPRAGWSSARPLGSGAFGRRDTECWFDDLVSVVVAGLPCVTLSCGWRRHAWVCG